MLLKVFPFLMLSLLFGVAHGEERAPVEFTNSVGMKLRLIPGGVFLMGSDRPPAEVAKRFSGTASNHTDEHPQHKVRISTAFYLATTEVTQSQWKEVMGTTPWKKQASIIEGDDYPAMNVSWEDALAFCERLTKRDGRTYTLPTEAEWEYAARAGKQAAFCFGDSVETLDEYAWSAENCRDGVDKYAQPVAKKRPNTFGLYDMHGNVNEFCMDRYGEYSRAAATDPTGPTTGEKRVCRGGCWYFNAWDSRSATRGRVSPDTRNYILGFRVKAMLK